MLTCKNVTEYASDYVDGKMSFWERIKFKFHLYMCPPCGRFIKQFKMTIGFSAKSTHECASEEEVKSVLEKVKQADANNSA